MPAYASLGALLFVVGLGSSPLDPALAQRDRGSPSPDSTNVLGQLIDRHTRQPIHGGEALIVGTRVTATTDSSGQFALSKLRPGTYALEVHAVGYTPVTWLLTVEGGQVVNHVFELDPLAVELPEVVVKGALPLSARRFADFERRRHSGMGAFLTQDRIEHANTASLVDVLVTVRGVQQVCISNECVAKMVRSPPGCYPQYYLDGRESSAYFARLTPPQDVKGVEIYRGSSETPGEFQGSNSGCGVIAIWTKSSP